MEAASNWVGVNWWWILIALGALTSILNAISKHWGQCYGIKKVIMFVLEMLSILTSAGASFGKLGKIKPPLWSVKPGGKK